MSKNRDDNGRDHNNETRYRRDQRPVESGADPITYHVAPPLILSPQLPRTTA